MMRVLEWWLISGQTSIDDIPHKPTKNEKEQPKKKKKKKEKAKSG